MQFSKSFVAAGAISDQNLHDDDCALRAFLKTYFPDLDRDQDQKINEAIIEIRQILVTTLAERAKKQQLSD